MRIVSDRLILSTETGSAVTDSLSSPDGAPGSGGVDKLVHVEALEALYREHGADLEAFLLGVLRDRHLASDAAQVVFRKALEHLAAVEEEEMEHSFVRLTAEELLLSWQSPRGWLFRVGWNEAMLVRRTQIRHRSLLEKAVWNRDLGRPEPSAPHSGLVQDEMVEAVRKAINDLPEEQRTVVRSRIYEDKTFAVIAEELGVPLGTVLTRMRLAMQKLERSLAKHQRPE